jgi:signal transduction histidine kinase
VKRVSVRMHVLTGAMVWTVGLFVGAMLLSTAIMVHLPDYAIFLHWTTLRHAGIATVLVVIGLVVGFLRVQKGLSPLQELRARVADVHAGRLSRVDGDYPSEVQPLVDDVNALLEYREEAVRRAIAKAGDLAHGLKTPLAVLAHEAERARRAGQAELAAAIDEQVDRMRRQMDYHLAHARAAASSGAPGARTSVNESIDALVRTLQRLHAERGLSIDVRVAAAQTAAVQREDLDEMIGNLLDNACKWAKSRVSIESAIRDGRVVIVVDDDGPGIPEAMQTAVLKRGVRADEAAPGSGFGLAIVRDLAELYKGAIALERAPLGGLRTRLELPS